MNQTRCRIDIHRCTHDDEIVAHFAQLRRGLDIRHSFAEPDDVRSQLGPVRSLIAEMYVVVSDIHNQVAVALAACFCQLAVQVQDILRAGLFVQVVDILSYNLNVIKLFQPHQLPVPLIGFDGSQLAAALVVEVQHQGFVFSVALRRSHILNAVLLPQAVAVAEGADSALGTDASAGKYNNLFHYYNTLISVLRFSPLPSSVSLVATGCVSP